MITPQERAFLATLSHSEGTDQFGKKDGYDVVVGGSLFDNDYKDHPRIYVHLPSLNIKSSAAGRYQILARIYDYYKRELKLPDFSPNSQDKIALKLIDECNARADINAGLFDLAVHKCRSRWASLPGAGYGQHEHKMSDLRTKFVEKGGEIRSV